MIFSHKSDEAASARVCKWDRYWVIQLWEYTGSDLSWKARETNRFHSPRSVWLLLPVVLNAKKISVSSQPLTPSHSHPTPFSFLCPPSPRCLSEWSIHPVLYEFLLWRWHGCYSITENQTWQKFMGTWTHFINLARQRWAEEKIEPVVWHARKELLLKSFIYFKERYGKKMHRWRREVLGNNVACEVAIRFLSHTWSKNRNLHTCTGKMVKAEQSIHMLIG